MKHCPQCNRVEIDEPNTAIAQYRIGSKIGEGGMGEVWSALTFVDTTGGVSNIWSLPLDGGKPVQLTAFKNRPNLWFDFSRDGKQLALSRGRQTSDVIPDPRLPLTA